MDKAQSFSFLIIHFELISLLCLSLSVKITEQNKNLSFEKDFKQNMTAEFSYYFLGRELLVINSFL